MQVWPCSVSLLAVPPCGKTVVLLKIIMLVSFVEINQSKLNDWPLRKDLSYLTVQY